MLKREWPEYAVKKTVGRHFTTPADEYRSDFRRDIGRVLYSKAFRRLAFKTQVFSPSQGDHYRNRLTHTLETAQIARVASMELGLNEDLAEVIALAHDLGHPPFGHQGEYVLDSLMKSYGGFDHNLQNIRIVTMLEIKSDQYKGLNLTYETMFGIAKGAEARKFISTLYNLPEEQGPKTCEAKIADLADDLAYTATDFDDFARYHDLTLEDLTGMELDLVQRCVPIDVSDVRIAVSMCVRNMVSTLVTDMIQNSRKNLEQMQGVNTKTSEAIHAFGLSEPISREYFQLNAFLKKYMYHDANLKSTTLEGSAALKNLFAHEVEVRKLQEGDKHGYHELCDNIAGMTDHYALELAAKI